MSKLRNSRADKWFRIWTNVTLREADCQLVGQFGPAIITVSVDRGKRYYSKDTEHKLINIIIMNGLINIAYMSFEKVQYISKEIFDATNFSRILFMYARLIMNVWTHGFSVSVNVCLYNIKNHGSLLPSWMKCVDIYGCRMSFTDIY